MEYLPSQNAIVLVQLAERNRGEKNRHYLDLSTIDSAFKTKYGRDRKS